MLYLEVPVQTPVNFFQHIFTPAMTVLLEYLDPMIHTYFVFFLLYNSVAEIVLVFNDNSLMHKAIFKLFPSAISPVGMSKVQPFSTQIIAPYTLDTCQIYAKLCTRMCQISRQSDCTLKIYSDFCKCAKRKTSCLQLFKHTVLT